LPYSRIDQIISECKGFLLELIDSPSYDCLAFRAANWAMQPTTNIVKAIINNGIKIDSSVYKWGKQHSNVNYDYSDAYSDIMAYPVDENEITRFNNESRLIELPIYTERKNIFSFITLSRIKRIVRAEFHRHQKNPPNNYNSDKTSLSLLKLMPRKLDFNHLSAKQIIHSLKLLEKKYPDSDSIPLVFIGHSKSYDNANDKRMNKVLAYMSSNQNYKFSTYTDYYNNTLMAGYDTGKS